MVVAPPHCNTAISQHHTTVWPNHMITPWIQHCSVLHHQVPQHVTTIQYHLFQCYRPKSQTKDLLTWEHMNKTSTTFTMLWVSYFASFIQVSLNTASVKLDVIWCWHIRLPNIHKLTIYVCCSLHPQLIHGWLLICMLLCTNFVYFHNVHTLSEAMGIRSSLSTFTSNWN